MPLTQKQLDARSRINTVFNAIAGRIALAQDNFFARKGRYLQVLETNPGVVLDAKTAPNRRSNPSDESETMESLGVTFPATMDFSLRCDVYQSPTEHGYTLTVTTRDGNTLASRTRLERGSEVSRAHAWVELIEDEI